MRVLLDANTAASSPELTPTPTNTPRGGLAEVPSALSSCWEETSFFGVEAIVLPAGLEPIDVLLEKGSQCLVEDFSHRDVFTREPGFWAAAALYKVEGTLIDGIHQGDNHMGETLFRVRGRIGLRQLLQTQKLTENSELSMRVFFVEKHRGQDWVVHQCSCRTTPSDLGDGLSYCSSTYPTMQEAMAQLTQAMDSWV